MDSIASSYPHSIYDDRVYNDNLESEEIFSKPQLLTPLYTLADLTKLIEITQKNIQFYAAKEIKAINYRYPKAKQIKDPKERIISLNSVFFDCMKDRINVCYYECLDVAIRSFPSDACDFELIFLSQTVCSKITDEIINNPRYLDFSILHKITTISNDKVQNIMQFCESVITHLQYEFPRIKDMLDNLNLKASQNNNKDGSFVKLFIITQIFKLASL